MELNFACRYPFTEEGKRAILENNIQINDMITEKAVDRIVAALNNAYKAANPMHISDQLIEIGSYGAARMMLAHLRNTYLTNKFAIAEAKKASSLMARERVENLKRLQEELGVIPGEFEGKVVVPLEVYVKFSPRSVDYRLINRNVKEGHVEVSKREVLRLMEEAVKMKVENVGILKNAPEIVKKYSNQLMKLVPKTAPSKMSFKEGENPPCIEKLLETAKKHENLGHQGRWTLAVYLINKGVPYEKVLQIFSNFPDYDERVASYQIKHAINRGYTVPSCGMLLSYGLCIANCKIGNPLRWKTWKRKKK
jgi:DNA primase large subunit